MLSHIVSDLHEVYVKEVIEPQLGKKDGPTKESSAVLKAGEGAEASAKRVRQATYDIRSRAKKSGEDLETEYRKYMGQSSMQGDEKNQVKEKLGLTDTSSSVKEETQAKKFQVRVKDKDTGKTYVRNATREKINQLRGNPNISSVEMTKYGKPSSTEVSKGSHTASVKSGRGLDQDGDGDTDFADIMSARMQASGVDKKTANKKVSDKPYNKKSGKVQEELSNWRDDLYEIVGEIKKNKKNTEDKISEKSNVNNKVIINPPLKEAVEEMGGEILDFAEVEESIFSGILDDVHDAELYFINDALIERVVIELFDECIGEGYEVDYVAETILESIDISLQIICEESDNDPKSDRRKGILNKIGRTVKRLAYGAGKVAGKAVKGAKKVAALAKKGYKSGSSDSSEKKSSVSRPSGESSGETGDKKEGMLSRIGRSLKSGIKRVIASGSRAISRGARNVARKMSEDLEMEALDTWKPEAGAKDSGDTDAKIKARKELAAKKKTTTAAPLSYLPPASALAALTQKKAQKANEEITKKTPVSDIISDFVHSKDPKFSGDTKQKRINRALGAYYDKSKKKVDEAIVDLATKSDDNLRDNQRNTVSKQQDQKKQHLPVQKPQQQAQKPNPMDRKLAAIQKTQLSAKLKQVQQGIPLKDSYEIEEAIKGLRSASERTKNAITPAQRKAQELARKRKEELAHKADLALAGMKKTAKTGAVTQTSSKPEAPEANRKLKTGKKVDTLAVKANKVISSSYEVDGDLVDEARAEEKRGLGSTGAQRQKQKKGVVTSSGQVAHPATSYSGGQNPHNRGKALTKTQRRASSRRYVDQPGGVYAAPENEQGKGRYAKMLAKKRDQSHMSSRFD